MLLMHNILSIHANSASISEAKGTEVYYSPGSVNGEKISKIYTR